MNIIFNEVSIEGFMSIDREVISLDDLGVVVVRGLNEYDPLFKSNGSGKSAIFDAILWGLTGYTSRGSSNVINRYQVPQTGTRVIIDFNLDDDHYKVTRTEGYEGGGKTLTIIKNDEDISGSTLTKSRDILREQLSFVNYDVLTSIIILSQGLSGRLSNLSPAHRKSRLEYLSNTDSVLEEIQAKVNGAYNEVVSELQELNSEKLKIESVISANNSTIASCNSKINEIKRNTDPDSEINEDNVDEYLKRVDELTSDITTLMDKYRSFNTMKSEHDSQLSRVTSRMQSLAVDIQRVANDWKSANSNRCPTCGKDLDDSGEILKSLSNSLMNMKSEYSELLDQKNDLDSKQIIDGSKYYDIATEYMRERDDIQSKLSRYEKSRASTSSYESTIVECNEVIEEKTEELKKVLEKIKSKEEELDIANFYKSAVSRRFRNFLLDGVIGYLNKRLAYYSEYLFSNEQVVYLESNKNNIDIRLGDSYFEDLSGGEGRRVDIILQLAQRDLSRSESGFNCNLLVLDEVLDYLDSDGIYSVLNMLEVESTSISTMMIVTHKDEISVPSDLELTVVKGEDRLSRITKL